MLKVLVGFFAGIAIMRYLSDDVITDEQKNQIAQNARNLFQNGTNAVSQISD